jgi:hypothetical protein
MPNSGGKCPPKTWVLSFKKTALIFPKPLKALNVLLWFKW